MVPVVWLHRDEGKNIEQQQMLLVAMIIVYKIIYLLSALSDPSMPCLFLGHSKVEI